VRAPPAPESRGRGRADAPPPPAAIAPLAAGAQSDAAERAARTDHAADCLAALLGLSLLACVGTYFGIHVGGVLVAVAAGLALVFALPTAASSWFARRRRARRTGPSGSRRAQSRDADR
jgi:hypothetical protein